MDTSFGAYNFFGTANSVYIYPANIRLDEGVLKTSLVLVFKRRLDQDEHIRLTHTSSEDVFKPFHKDQHIRLDNTS